MKVKAFIITLKNNSRLHEIEKTLVALYNSGVYVVYFDAIDAKNITYYIKNDFISEMVYENDKIFIENSCLSDDKMLKGVRACCWSHINIYKKIIEENDPDMKYLIFEDDAWINMDIQDFIPLFKTTINNVPEDYDLCHFGNSVYNPFYKKNKINDYFYDVHRGPINNAHAYLLSLKGAKKMLDLCQNIIREPPDNLIASCLQFVEHFMFYIPESPLFIQKPQVKSIITDCPNP
jgi:GR25 family glycosyltransferase involved in LPS biosynthesis